MLGATVLNIALMVLLSLIMFTIITVVVPKDWDPTLVQYIYYAVFFVSFGGSFFINNLILKFISSKVDMDKYFEPFLSRRK